MRCKLTFRANYANFNLCQWAVGSTSKGGRAGGGRGALHTQSKGGRFIVKLHNLSCPLDVYPVVQIEVCTVCTKRSVCNLYMAMIISPYYYKHRSRN